MQDKEKVPLLQYEKAKKIEKITDNAMKGLGWAIIAVLVLGGVWLVCFLLSLLLPIPWLFWTLTVVVSVIAIGCGLGAINEHYTEIRMKGDQIGVIDE